MNTPLDESLHSFLIRQQLLHMYKFDPKGVITTNGRWRGLPFAHHDVTHLFEKYSDLFLLEAIDVDIQLGEKNHQFFDSPDSYCTSINQVFFQGSTNKYISGNSWPIKFCSICIKDMIKEYGFGYFKKDWLDGVWCNAHKTPLRSLRSETYKESVNLVKDLLAGKKVLSRAVKNAALREAARAKAVSDDSLKLFYPVKGVSCSGRLLGHCLISYIDDLRKLKLSVDDGWWKIWLSRLIFEPLDSVEYFSAKNDLGRLIAVLQSFPPVIECIKNDFFYVRVWVGARCELSEVLLVPNERPCDGCMDLRCKELLKNAHVIEDVDLEYLVENSSSLKRLAFQQMHLPVTGPHPWSPLRIKNWISEDELATAAQIDMHSGGVSK